MNIGMISAGSASQAAFSGKKGDGKQNRKPKGSEKPAYVVHIVSAEEKARRLERAKK